MNYRPPLPDRPETLTIGGDTGGVRLTLYVVDAGRWLLTDAQVGKALGIQPHLTMYCKRNRELLLEGRDWFMKEGKLPKQVPSLRLWTNAGLVALAQLVTTTQAKNLLAALGIRPQEKRPRVESEYRAAVLAAFESVLPVQHSYPAAGYSIDIYFPTLSLAVEIDEHGHEGYNPASEAFREARIRAELGCDIIRFNPHETGSNVGNLINMVLRRAGRSVVGASG